MPAAPAPPPAPSRREAGLDALRAGAMLVGILFHAAVPYAVTPLRGLPWLVAFPQGSRLLDLFFWASHAVRMPLFFLLSGLLAARALARRGPGPFASSRLRRLGLPLLLPGLPVLAVLLYTWCAGWWLGGRCTVSEIRALKFDDPAIQSGFLGPAHLWFLGDLLLVSVAWAAASSRRLAASSGPAAVAAGASAAALLVFLEPRVVVAFRNSFVPDPARLAYHAAFFLAGTALARRGPADRASSARRPAAVLTASIVLFAGSYRLLPTVASGSASTAARGAFALCWAGAAFAAVLALVALARRAQHVPRLVTGLVDASYWVYLVHLPLVGAFQLAVAPLRLPAVAGWAVAVLGTATVALASWRPARRTFLGPLLGSGRDDRPSPQPSPAGGSFTSPAETQRSRPAQNGQSGQLPPSG